MFSSKRCVIGVQTEIGKCLRHTLFIYYSSQKVFSRRTVFPKNTVIFIRTQSTYVHTHRTLQYFRLDSFRFRNISFIAKFTVLLLWNSYCIVKYGSRLVIYIFYNNSYYYRKSV